MSEMTWNEFKAFVDEELSKQEADPNTIVIECIDINRPDLVHENYKPDVQADLKHNTFTVWN